MELDRSIQLKGEGEEESEASKEKEIVRQDLTPTKASESVTKTLNFYLCRKKHILIKNLELDWLGCARLSQ